MRPERANRLLDKATDRAADGTPTRGARRAWTRLLAAADAGHPDAIDAMQEAWFRDPRDDTWAELSGWLRLTDVLAAAVDPARRQDNRAALGAFCVEHGAVPDSAVERVVFFVLTGQRERYEAADPDGSLLAGAYRTASGATREALRHSMVDAGELNLVRAVADRQERVLDDGEADYVTERLAGEDEWERLWRQLPAMSIPAAIRAARRFPGWRPADDAGRAYLDRLAVADPGAPSVLTAAAVTGLDLPFGTAVSFAPDDSAIAVVVERGVRVFALPGGRLVQNHPGRYQRGMLMVDDTSIVYQDNPYKSVLLRGPGGVRQVLDSGGMVATLARTPTGFVVEISGTVWPGSPAGVGRSMSMRRADGGVAILAGADPVGGDALFTVSNGSEDSVDLVLVDAELTELARGRHAGWAFSAVFCGPGRFLLAGSPSGSVQLWQRDGRELVRTATAESIDLDDPVPVGDRVAIPGIDGLTWLDAATLAPVPPPPGYPTDADAELLGASSSGSLVAVNGDDGVEVHDLWLCQVADVLARPLSRARPEDLTTLDPPANRRLTGPVGETVDLLRAGLRFRFGRDIALGSGNRATAGADDIALGGG